MVKDQTSISIAKVSGTVAPDLEVLVVKATSHDNEPADDKYAREIIHLTSYAKGYVNAFVLAISKRLSKTHDWIVALKSLMLVHRLLDDGPPIIVQEIMYASRKGAKILNMSDFRDEAHSSSWDHSGFVRTYALYLDQKLELMIYEGKLSVGSKSNYDFDESEGQEQKKRLTPVREMKPERVLERLNQLLKVLDRFLACRPTGSAKSSRMVIIALYPVVKESFRLYLDICEVLRVLLDRFMEMEYVDCVKAFDAYVNAGKMMDELVGFYNFCKDTGVARSSEYPEVERITNKLIGTLEGFLRERANGRKTLEKTSEESSLPVTEEPVLDINDIKALPPPENYTPPQASPQPLPKPQQPQPMTEDLVNLKEEISIEDESNKYALALFSAPLKNEWETFPSDTDVVSADWELALVETASNLSNQKADLAGGFDTLLLNGMYDQGSVRQHVSNAQLNGGSASSVALPGAGKSATSLLALPAPDGSMQIVGHQDPFAASLSVAPPSYVQMSDMEKKQYLLVQEQQIWQQYGSSGMQGQVSLANLGSQQTMPYGVPPGGYYYAQY